MLEDNDLLPGLRVKIVGLDGADVDAEQRKFNMTEGTVTKYDEKLSRWRVKMDADGKTR